KLLEKQGKLTGKKVAVLASSTVAASVKSVVLPGLKKLGVSTGTPAYLTVNGPDTTAAQAQLASFIERWKSENVNALFVASINDACQSLSLFHDVATRVGKYLNTANWVYTVDHYGPIANRGGGPYASLRQGKYDFDDTFQLQSFDPTIPPTGNWKTLTPYENIPG